MKRAILCISGNVQRVGYRSRVVSIAKAFDIKGIVQNLTDGKVKIIAEGEEQHIKQFIQAVNVTNTIINVTNIETQYSVPSREYNSFYKLVDEGETDDRLDTAADLLKELIHVTKNGFDRLEVKQDIMIEKQDVMIEKQDVMIEKQDVMIEKQDVMIEKQDVMIEKQDIMIEKQDVMIVKQDIMIGKQDKMLGKMDQNTSILKDFKNETHENFNHLSNMVAKHDVDASERFFSLTSEISNIKERLSRLESANV